MLYKNCRELPIHNFNECMEGNFSYLVISGEHSEIEIQEKWIGIIDEYNSLITKGADINISKKAEILGLHLKINLITILQELKSVESLADGEFKDLIKKYGKPTLLAGLKNKLNRKLNELPEQKDSENDFDKTLAVLNSQGFNVDRFKTPVSEYIKMLELLDEKFKAIQNSRKQGK
ncbi:hypothetical protein GO491_11795 [Flavobacteriaceae bacterium Ap0902]|nr:hypothetical protein [Flavobacteriaceae bacterium Ap0902]